MQKRQAADDSAAWSNPSPPSDESDAGDDGSEEGAVDPVFVLSLLRKLLPAPDIPTERLALAHAEEDRGRSGSSDDEVYTPLQRECDDALMLLDELTASVARALFCHSHHLAPLLLRFLASPAQQPASTLDAAARVLSNLARVPSIAVDLAARDDLPRVALGVACAAGADGALAARLLALMARLVTAGGGEGEHESWASPVEAPLGVAEEPAPKRQAVVAHDTRMAPIAERARGEPAAGARVRAWLDACPLPTELNACALPAYLVRLLEVALAQGDEAASQLARASAGALQLIVRWAPERALAGESGLAIVNSLCAALERALCEAAAREASGGPAGLAALGPQLEATTLLLAATSQAVRSLGALRARVAVDAGSRVAAATRPPALGARALWPLLARALGSSWRQPASDRVASSASALEGVARACESAAEARAEAERGAAALGASDVLAALSELERADSAPSAAHGAMLVSAPIDPGTAARALCADGEACARALCELVGFAVRRARDLPVAGRALEAEAVALLPAWRCLGLMCAQLDGLSLAITPSQAPKGSQREQQPPSERDGGGGARWLLEQHSVFAAVIEHAQTLAWAHGMTRHACALTERAPPGVRRSATDAHERQAARARDERGIAQAETASARALADVLDAGDVFRAAGDEGERLAEAMGLLRAALDGEVEDAWPWHH